MSILGTLVDHMGCKTLDANEVVIANDVIDKGGVDALVGFLVSVQRERDEDVGGEPGSLDEVADSHLPRSKRSNTKTPPQRDVR